MSESAADSEKPSDTCHMRCRSRAGPPNACCRFCVKSSEAREHFLIPSARWHIHPFGGLGLKPKVRALGGHTPKATSQTLLPPTFNPPTGEPLFHGFSTTALVPIWVSCSRPPATKSPPLGSLHGETRLLLPQNHICQKLFLNVWRGVPRHPQTTVKPQSTEGMSVVVC